MHFVCGRSETRCVSNSPSRQIPAHRVANTQPTALIHRNPAVAPSTPPPWRSNNCDQRVALIGGGGKNDGDFGGGEELLDKARLAWLYPLDVGPDCYAWPVRQSAEGAVAGVADGKGEREAGRRGGGWRVEEGLRGAVGVGGDEDGGEWLAGGGDVEKVLLDKMFSSPTAQEPVTTALGRAETIELSLFGWMQQKGRGDAFR